MTVQRMHPSGGWIVSDIINGYLVSRRYFGYTKLEAIKLFRAEFIKRNTKSTTPSTGEKQ